MILKRVWTIAIAQCQQFWVRDSETVAACLGHGQWESCAGHHGYRGSIHIFLEACEATKLSLELVQCSRKAKHQHREGVH